MNSTQLEKLNDIFGAELGRTDGRPNYAWLWSEDSRLKHGMRVEGKYEYKADPDTGLLEAKPVYETRKLCMTATSQWVLCLYQRTPSEEEWRQMFGYRLEWPKGGQYWPTNVKLDPGFDPDANFTLETARIVKQTLEQKASQLEAEYLARQERKEKAEQSRIYDEIRDMLPTYDHIPGTCDLVSYPRQTPLDTKVALEMAVAEAQQKNPPALVTP